VVEDARPSKAQAKNYIGEIQRRLIVQPVIEHLLAIFGSPRDRAAVNETAEATAESTIAAGYVGGNVLNLLVHLKTDLRCIDFSELAVAG